MMKRGQIGARKDEKEERNIPTREEERGKWGAEAVGKKRKWGRGWEEEKEAGGDFLRRGEISRLGIFSLSCPGLKGGVGKNKSGGM